MKYTGTTYRPPWEADSLLLQVTVGCAHNKCTFCTMYRDTRFAVESLEQVESDLKEAAQFYTRGRRVFLVNGDAFVLPAKKLETIAKLIHKYLPQVEVISMYAAINNVKNKSDDQLKMLAQLGINDLWFGTETGHERTLAYMNKGFTLDDTYEQLDRINNAGIRHFDGIILGGAGHGKGIENAEANAKLVNTVKPAGIAITTMGAFGNSPLAKDVANGTFVPASEREILEEQIQLLELINVNTVYLGIHAINTVRFDLTLPQKKEEAIANVQKVLDAAGDKLDLVPMRNAI